MAISAQTIPLLVSELFRLLRGGVIVLLNVKKLDSLARNYSGLGLRSCSQTSPIVVIVEPEQVDSVGARGFWFAIQARESYPVIELGEFMVEAGSCQSLHIARK